MCVCVKTEDIVRQLEKNNGQKNVIAVAHFRGVGGEGREGGEKSAPGAPAGAGARTGDMPRARRRSPAARHGGCLDKQAFPCL